MIHEDRTPFQLPVVSAVARHRVTRSRDPRSVGLAVAHAPAARIAACGRLRSDGAPAKNHGAIKLSNIMQPNAELGMNGQMGWPHR